MMLSGRRARRPGALVLLRLQLALAGRLSKSRFGQFIASRHFVAIGVPELGWHLTAQFSVFPG